MLPKPQLEITSRRLRFVAAFLDRPLVELPGFGDESKGKAAREGRGHKLPCVAAVSLMNQPRSRRPMEIGAEPSRSPNDGRSEPEGSCSSVGCRLPIVPRPSVRHLRPA